MTKEVISNSFQTIYYQKLSELVDVSQLKKEDVYIVQVEDNNKNVTHSGFFKESEIAFLTNEMNINEFLKKEVKEILLLSKDYLAEFNRYGGHLYAYLKDLANEPLEKKENKSKNIFNDLNNQNFELVISGYTDSSVHFLQDTKGLYYVGPIHLDWIEGQLQNKDFHLDEFVEELSKRDDVSFVTYTSRWSDKKTGILHAPLKGDEIGIGGIINDTEFNTEDGEEYPAPQENITLIYYPKQEDALKIIAWERKDGYKPENHSREVYTLGRYITRDLLGGDKFYKYQPKPEEVPVRKFKH